MHTSCIPNVNGVRYDRYTRYTPGVNVVFTVMGTEYGGCGPEVRLLACHERALRSIPYWRESSVFNLMN